MILCNKGLGILGLSGRVVSSYRRVQTPCRHLPGSFESVVFEALTLEYIASIFLSTLIDNPFRIFTFSSDVDFFTSDRGNI